MSEIVFIYSFSRLSHHSRPLGIAQNYLITAIADVNGNVAESNEANNEKTLAITVQ